MPDYYDFDTQTGIVIPDTSTLLTDVQNEYKAVFGQDLIVTPDTSQGVLITAEVLARKAVIDNNAQLANQINPNVAGGIFLSALWQLLGGQQQPLSYTVVTCTVTGVPGTIIPISASAQTTSGDLFSPVTFITIGPDGNGSGDFQAQQPGPISVVIGSLSMIINSVLGWETVTNPQPGVIGTIPVSDAQLRLLRLNTLALQGTALPEAITSALLDPAVGVSSLFFQENVTSSTTTINGVTMLGHSIYVCVAASAGPSNFVSLVGVVTGTPGTVIGTSAIASDGTFQYSPVEAITLNALGNGSGVWVCTTSGPNATAANTMTTIVTPITGWATVNNPQPSSVYSNDFLTAVATVLLAKKSAGCNYSSGPGVAPYGPQVINVVEPASGQSYPVTFDVVTPIQILAQVTITVSSSFVGDPVLAVQNAILTYATGGLASDPGFVVGASVSAFELAGAINIQNPGIYVSLLQVSKASSISYGNTVSIHVYEQATVIQSAITVYT